MTETFDITPSTRILRMLGEIDFSAVQCLCELIDNSIDAFDSEEKQAQKPTIIINTPAIPKSACCLKMTASQFKTMALA